MSQFLLLQYRQQRIINMNQYTLQSKLGEGAFSTVYKVNRKEDGLDYAMKKMRIMGFSEKQLANCLNEVRILASIEDQNVVSYKDSFFDQLTKTFCIVTEYLDGGDLAHVISKHKNNKKCVEQKFIWSVAYHALKGLDALHKQKILHRDIKSANIFMTKDQKQIKLGDMNVSIVSSNGMAKTQTGTPYYASPEVWNQKPYSSKCDIWSLGCVLYELCTFRPPFISNDMKTLKRMIISGVYKRIPNNYTDQLQQFIRKCLKVDPFSRPSSEELLKHTRFCTMSELQNMNKTQFRLLDKINVPRKRDFRIIKDRLPKNRFSVDKMLSNSTCLSQKDKENIPSSVATINLSNSMKIQKGQSSKLIRKQTLPSINRPVSASGSLQQTQKVPNSNNQVQVIEPMERPPLPKNKPLRA